ncbi:MAG TPA: hypothetical protein VGE74_12355 [Gemmata sp.]
MGLLPFICAALAGWFAEQSPGLAVFFGLCSVTFAIGHGAMLIADVIDETY